MMRSAILTEDCAIAFWRSLLPEAIPQAYIVFILCRFRLQPFDMRLDGAALRIDPAIVFVSIHVWLSGFTSQLEFNFLLRHQVSGWRYGAVRCRW